MQWHDIFQPVTNLSPDEARALLRGRDNAAIQILDVRQPDEYQHGHLPGARLVPIKELADRSGELDAGLPTLVYCAVGGRSRVAAQLLVGKGFATVYNLAGGIRAWKGAVASGPLEQGFDLIPPDADFATVWHLAWAMEDGLENFYLDLAGMLPSVDGANELCRRLAGMEVAHKKRLESFCLEITPSPSCPDGRGKIQPLVEGGWDRQKLRGFVAAGDDNRRAVMETALLLETQAMDLYSRLSRRHQEVPATELFTLLAGEEKTHMESVADWLEHAEKPF